MKVSFLNVDDKYKMTTHRVLFKSLFDFLWLFKIKKNRADMHDGEVPLGTSFEREQEHGCTFT